MDAHKKYSLGHRAFLLFLSRRIKFAIFLFALTGALWYGERWAPPSYFIWTDYAVKVLALLCAAYLFLVIFQSYLEYRYYTYIFTDEAFIVTSGYVERNEVAALYHQIQNVNISRGIMDRFAGVSQIFIVMTGAEREGGHNKIVLPAVGKGRAKAIQKELLVRARKHIARDS